MSVRFRQHAANVLALDKLTRREARMNNHASIPSIDSEPPLALDKFIEQSSLSGGTVWR